MAGVPDFNAQPAVAQPDPAREYYNGLLAQGYPHEDAVRYTQVLPRIPWVNGGTWP